MKASEKGKPSANEQLQLATARVQQAGRAVRAAEDKLPLAKAKYKSARKAFKQTKKLAKKAAKFLRQARKELKALGGKSRQDKQSPAVTKSASAKPRRRAARRLKAAPRKGVHPPRVTLDARDFTPPTPAVGFENVVISDANPPSQAASLTVE